MYLSLGLLIHPPSSRKKYKSSSFSPISARFQADAAAAEATAAFEAEDVTLHQEITVRHVEEVARLVAVISEKLTKIPGNSMQVARPLARLLWTGYPPRA